MTQKSNSSPSQGNKVNYAMQRFGKEHDQYKGFLVTHNQDQSARIRNVKHVIGQVDRVGGGGKNNNSSASFPEPTLDTSYWCLLSYR